MNTQLNTNTALKVNEFGFSFKKTTLAVSGVFIGNDIEGYGGTISISSSLTKSIKRQACNYYKGERFSADLIKQTMNMAKKNGHVMIQRDVDQVHLHQGW